MLYHFLQACTVELFHEIRFECSPNNSGELLRLCPTPNLIYAYMLRFLISAPEADVPESVGSRELLSVCKSFFGFVKVIYSQQGPKATNHRGLWENY